VKSLRNVLIIFLLLSSSCLVAQVKFSLATDVSLIHSFDEEQKFTSVGQTVIPQWHFDKKSTLYAWFSYHANGKYNTTLTATAKSPSTQPQSFTFSNESEMRLRQISVGYKRYFLGSFESLEKFNLYAAGGFGLMFGTASNTFSTIIDTSLYTINSKVVHGTGDFKRLTFDLTGGIEFPVAYEVFVYSEIRMHLPTTDYPSNYLMKSSNAPFLGGINLGIRVLFNADP
jgi:hypothetical protein